MSTARKGTKKTAKTATPEQPAPQPSVGPAGERRATEGRRASEVDRRAFWRPTPDRRREEREVGRRSSDGTTG